MSARFLCCVSLIGVMAGPIALLPSSAQADTIVIPGITTVDRTHPRPRYREAAFPPPQYDLLHRRVALNPKARPTYRQASNDFPPPGGRFGGGFLEYVLTGGRPEPIAPGEPVSPSPVARFFSPGPYAAPNPGPLSPYPLPSLPLSSLPLPSPPLPTVYSPAPPSPRLPAGGLPAILPGVTEPVTAPLGVVSSAEPQTTLFNLPDGGQLGGQPYADPQALAPEPRRARPIDPAFERQEVAYSGPERAGTVIIDTPRKYLFLVRPGGRALRYGIGEGGDRAVVQERGRRPDAVERAGLVAERGLDHVAHRRLTLDRRRVAVGTRVLVL